MKITNISQGPRGVNTPSGPVLIEPGQEVDVELSAAEAKVSKATGWFDMSGKAKAEPAGEPTGLVASHRGGGRYFVMDGNNAVGEAMTKEDAEAFNALSDEDKAAFVAKA
jgi:hypothetical protein